MKILFYVSASMTLIVAGCPSVGAQASSATICELAARPSKWRQRTVRIAATYFSDRMHYSGLKDDRCPKIWFQDQEAKRGDRESLEAFDRAVLGDGRSIRTTLFHVDILGRVSYRRDGRSSGRITILRVLSYREFERPKSISIGGDSDQY